MSSVRIYQNVQLISLILYKIQDADPILQNLSNTVFRTFSILYSKNRVFDFTRSHLLFHLYLHPEHAEFPNPERSDSIDAKKVEKTHLIKIIGLIRQ